MKHFFQRGSCIYCKKPIAFMGGVQFWRGGHILPPEEKQEDCPCRQVEPLDPDAYDCPIHGKQDGPDCPRC